MRRLLLAGTAFLTLAASAPAAHAQRFKFSYTGSLVTFTAPINGTYQIIAFGAQGGDSGTFIEPFGGLTVVGAGSPGAEIGGDFSLTAGETLQIAVGGAGVSGTTISSLFIRGGGGGGGGSFVVGPADTPLVIAGGGGGGGFFFGGPNPDPGSPGEGGLTGPNGGGLAGGTGGNGACRATNFPIICGGGGGGGFFSAGANVGGSPGGGAAFPDLTGGSADNTFGVSGNGGFGGGGGGARDCGGGGGGYSGGESGLISHFGCGGGGGGGSFNAGANQILVAGIWTGNGQVVIDLLSPVFAGTPGKANCHGQSVSALARQFGGLNAAAQAIGYSDVNALQQAIMEFCEG